MMSSAKHIETALLGGGCFWCLEPVFAALRGVESVEPGYAGGHVDNPEYAAVCEGNTGHAEVVQVRFDPSLIAFADILEVFFALHDPTTLNRQGNDVGTQYRSVVFCQDPGQEQALRQAMARLEREGAYGAPIVTEVAGPARFFLAEDYHRRYFERNPQQPYCSALIAPKLAKLRRSFSPLLA